MIRDAQRPRPHDYHVAIARSSGQAQMVRWQFHSLKGYRITIPGKRRYALVLDAKQE